MERLRIRFTCICVYICAYPFADLCVSASHVCVRRRVPCRLSAHLLVEEEGSRYNYIIRYPQYVLSHQVCLRRSEALTTPWPSWRRPFPRAHDPDRAVKHLPLHPAWMCCSDGTDLAGERFVPCFTICLPWQMGKRFESMQPAKPN